MTRIIFEKVGASSDILWLKQNNKLQTKPFNTACKKLEYFTLESQR